MEHKAEYDVFEVWKEYEKMAIHFNDLLMRLRTQALAGVAILATFGGYILNAAANDNTFLIVGTASFVLFLFWFAIAVLDFGYYNRMLSGTSEALSQIEKSSKLMSKVYELNLSTYIKATVQGGRDQFRYDARFWFYVIVGAALLLVSGICFSITEHYKEFPALHLAIAALFTLFTGCNYLHKKDRPLKNGIVA